MLIELPHNDIAASVVGPQDSTIRLLKDSIECDIVVRGNQVTVSGREKALAVGAIEEIVRRAQSGVEVTEDVVRDITSAVISNHDPSLLDSVLLTTHRGKRVQPKSPNQAEYLESMVSNIITFGIGPAGTGKSWLAVAAAVAALYNNEVEKVILTRPAVEAGERLGYLPGDLMSKVDPYLRPLYDGIIDMVGTERSGEMFDQGLIEVAPLAYMRGRTLNNCFVILDEAQNTTPEQMMMFLTRIGFGTRCVITGDRTQTDLAGANSGLSDIDRILNRIDGLGFVYFDSSDVVRHRIVADIVDAYAKRKK